MILKKPRSPLHSTVECSFSKLKLIKMFHRSTMTDKRLANLAMISIYGVTAKPADMTKVFPLTQRKLVFLESEVHH